MKCENIFRTLPCTNLLEVMWRIWKYLRFIWDSLLIFSMELYHADTGKLLCAHYPVYGKTHQIFDELVKAGIWTISNYYLIIYQGYIAIPPCLWGTESEGLLPPVYLPYDANLLSIKRNNNTWAHYGDMAMWQMRGVLVKQSSEWTNIIKNNIMIWKNGCPLSGFIYNEIDTMSSFSDLLISPINFRIVENHLGDKV